MQGPGPETSHYNCRLLVNMDCYVVTYSIDSQPSKAIVIVFDVPVKLRKFRIDW
jgi:hypothetical protein